MLGVGRQRARKEEKEGEREREIEWDDERKKEKKIRSFVRETPARPGSRSFLTPLPT